MAVDRNFLTGIEEASTGSGNIIKNYSFPAELKSENFSMRRVTLRIFKNKHAGDVLSGVAQNAGGSIGLMQSPNADGSNNTKDNMESIQLDGVLKSVTNSGSDGSLFGKNGEVSKYTEYKYDFPKSECEFQISLPVPNQFTESYFHSFSPDSGFVGSTLDSIGLNGVADKVQRVAAHLGLQKVLPNQDKFQNYTGSDPRSFDMIFKIVPNSKEEAIEASKIVYTLKKASSPELNVGNLVMIQPKFFTIEFGNPVLHKLVNPLPCVLRSVSCTYDDGTYVSTTIDGMPKVITLSLSFSEVRVKTSNDFDRLNQTNGKGGNYSGQYN